MTRVQEGFEIDGFIIGHVLHSGAMAKIFETRYADGTAGPGFNLVMKIPRMTEGDGAENILSFEVEHQILQVIHGTHVPRFVAAGDLRHLPYLVMERIDGHTIQQMLDEARHFSAEEIAHIGVALSKAVHSLHRQNACHLDLKPANVMLRPDGTAVLLDFGLSCHAHYPDLLAEEMRKAVGSPAWMAPEQVVGVRGDPRSDIFAIGVILYELACQELPFGNPRSAGGLRQRLWMEPPSIRAIRPETPEWLQEIILRCLEAEADKRYPSAAHLALELSNPEQVVITERGRRTHVMSFGQHIRRWIRSVGMHYEPSALPSRKIDEVPIVMVAIPHQDVNDATLYSLRQAVSRSLGIRPGARLACITVVGSGQISTIRDADSETSVQRRYLSMLHDWARPLDLHGHQVSFHVLEASDVAHAIIRYASANHASLIVMGAATHGIQTQRLIATIPIKVAMYAPCTVMLVKATLPFERLSNVDIGDIDEEVLGSVSIS